MIRELCLNAGALQLRQVVECGSGVCEATAFKGAKIGKKEGFNRRARRKLRAEQKLAKIAKKFLTGGRRLWTRDRDMGGRFARPEGLTDDSGHIQNC
jgi:hypothetical protein